MDRKTVRKLGWTAGVGGFLLCWGVCAGNAAPLYAQFDTGAVLGTVFRFFRGKPWNGAAVTLTNEGTVGGCYF